MPVRRLLRTIVIVTLAGVALSACDSPDARLKTLTVGLTKDSTLAAMGGGEPFRVDPYLVDGHYIEAMFYGRAGSSAEQAAALDPRKLSPVIVIDGQLSGWGWSFWDSVAAVHGIEVPPATK